MLELHDAEGAFAALEDYLAAEDFWGRTGVVADLYLGYGLSDALRRTATSAPPEPCPLPLLACRIRTEDGRPPDGDFSLASDRRLGAHVGRRRTTQRRSKRCGPRSRAATSTR